MGRSVWPLRRTGIINADTVKVGGVPTHELYVPPHSVYHCAGVVAYYSWIVLGAARNSKSKLFIDIVSLGIIGVVFDEPHPNETNYLVNVTDMYVAGGEETINNFVSSHSANNKHNVRIMWLSGTREIVFCFLLCN